MIWLALVGCKKVEPAPEDLDALFHYAFEKFDSGTDEEMHEAIRNLDKVVNGKNFEYFDGTLTNLSKEAVEELGIDRDPKLAPGVFLVNDVECGWNTHKRLLVHPNQGDFHKTYDEYERDYHGDYTAWPPSEIDEISWDLSYTVKSTWVDYGANTKGALRTIPPIDDELSPFGEVVFGKTYLPQPAEFDNDNKNMLQDYHMEMYWRRNGVVLHAYALWRQADWGAGLTTENEGMQRIALNALEDWDDDNEKACESDF